MSDSIQSRVLDAVVAALGGAAGAAYRCRMEAFTSAQLPADNILPESEAAENADTGSLDVQHRFTVRHVAQSGNLVDKTVDARFVRGQQRILADPTLGGLVLSTQYIGRKWEFERGEVDTVALAVTYEVKFSTRRSDPTVSWP